jgi:hypothetical protein
VGNATAETVSERIPIQCARCTRTVQVTPTATGEARLPRAWKRHADAVWCDRCWHAAYVLRAVTIPVAAPLDVDGSTGEAASWSALRTALRTSWQGATAIANWAVAQLATADAVRTPAMPSLPPMPRVYLYPGARRIAPEVTPTSVAAILRAVEARYRARRYHVVWRRAEALPTYRYPAPYPVHNQAWHAAVTDEGALTVSVPLAGQRWTLRLRGGVRFARLARAVRSLIAGEAVAGELALLQRGTDVLCKMVLWLPRPAGREGRAAAGTLVVRTGGDALWTYHVDDEEPRYLHADQVRRWILAYDRRRQRLAHDTKAEKRPTKRRGRGIAEARAVWGAKHRARLDSWAHEATAMLAGYAARQHVALVIYDDRDRSYLPRAPWALLRERLRYKLDAVGIALEVASGEVIEESPGPLDVAD